METTYDIEQLFAEIERYLAAVAAFRAAGHEPRWVDAGEAAWRRRRK